jgi:N-acetylglutamate synthase-like GNAT family acetyltransferase
MTPTLRPAHADDWPGIRGLLEARQLPVDGAEAHLRDFLVATNGVTGALIGVAGLERHGGVGLVRSVAVADDVAARGLGTALVRALLLRAAERGIGAVYLLTTTAAGWFPRFGFRVVRREDLPPALGESAELRGACPGTAVAMELHL